MLRIAFFVLLISMIGDSVAQRGLMERKRPELIPREGKVRRGGFYFGPGLTYTLPRFNNDEVSVQQRPDTSYSVTYDPEGRLGFYFEAGYFYATRDPIILDYWDVGIAYKNLRGSESLESTIILQDTGATALAEGSFAERYVSLHLNANKFFQVADYQFIQLSLGANVDQRIGSSYEHSGDPLLHGHEFPPDLIGQVHVKLGYGFKVTGSMLIIPTLETPVFSIVPEDDGFGQLQWFSSTYRPIILTVRFLFLRPRKGFDCPPVIKHNAFEKERTKKYKPDSYHP